ncbi:ATP-binding protein [Denitromonas ohlonensis]|uniref:histidine kinase n=2 Tax=Denitromonas TaxID=139331 RepID=A0A557R322_9RHOO|nr:ATP-binding protein [Denitromonas ohlonensis]TVO59561.1 HAMP domain-containing protein [Denitromonas ohlonensis]TVO76385.1 HAMP domain-containing protein [Denitromonas ohlonensis]
MSGPKHRRGHSLFRRLMLIWLLGLAVVIAVSLGLSLGASGRALRDQLYTQMAHDIASAARLMDYLPPAERADWLTSLDRPYYRFALAPPPERGYSGEHLEDEAALDLLRDALGDRPFTIRGEWKSPAGRPALYLGLTLTDGTPFSVTLTSPAGFMPRGRLFAAGALLVLGVMALTWLAVRLATRPISRLADAARALGDNPERDPLPEDTGPREVRDAARAFNQMQTRIRSHMAERTQILAAISHDLQTPITRLRLRSELLDDAATQTRFNADLDAMQALVREGLDYARSLDSNEASRSIDLNALLDTLRLEADEMAMPVTLDGRASQPYTGRLQGLRRALWNLIDNGVKYGERVDITVTETDTGWQIDIRDHGPGLPESERESVFEPFYRREASRNRDTGGTGLGLAITRNLLRAQGGEVVLENADGGGLRARVTLTRAG